MKIFADLHIHSKYSRATSQQMDLEHLSRYGREKGLGLIGTGDFTHPKWLAELKQKLSGDGIYIHSNMNFVLTAEVSNIYSTQKGVKRIHHVLIAPDFGTVDQINSLLAKHGNLSADGRPIFGRYTSPELVDDMVSISEDILVIPAHIWTPWFSLFGSQSGFDSIDECYGDAARHIYALETGLSSDPAMNWRLSMLDKFTLVSNSDSHSPWPLRMGRECKVFDIELTYSSLIKAIKSRSGFLFTIETDPAYGKYHWDGHRDCGVSMAPGDAIKNKNICPACGRPLTIGVEHRVEQLADRPAGYRPAGAVPFVRLLPLKEIIAPAITCEISTKKVAAAYQKLIDAFDNEFRVLLDVPRDELRKIAGDDIADAIIDVREQRIDIKPGYDGVYGKPILRDKPKGLKKYF